MAATGCHNPKERKMSKTTYITIDASADQAAAQALLATSFSGTDLAGTPETDQDIATGITVTPDCKHFVFSSDGLPEHDDSATDGSTTVYRFEIDGLTIFLENGEMQDGLHIYPAGTSIKTMLREFETGDLDMPEHLASWGYDGTPDEAGADATDVRVWCEPCYYAGSLGAPIGHYVVDERHDELVFDTVAAAQKWIDEAEEGIYSLSHGEAGRPEYTVCK